MVTLAVYVPGLLALAGRWLRDFLAATIAACVIPSGGILTLLVLGHGHIDPAGVEAIGYLWPYMVFAAVVTGRYEWWHRRPRVATR